MYPPSLIPANTRTRLVHGEFDEHAATCASDVTGACDPMQNNTKPKGAMHYGQYTMHYGQYTMHYGRPTYSRHRIK